MPCAPPLTELLHRHVTEFGTGNDGRLIRGVRSDDLSDSTYGRVWQNARAPSCCGSTPSASPVRAT